MAAPAPKDIAAATAQGDLKAVEYLISQGADVNKKSKDGMTPLSVTAFWGYSDIAKLLMKNGAEVTAQNNGTHWTPLHCAAFQGHGPVILKLLEAGADPNIKDMRGRTAVDFGSAVDAIWPLFAAAGCKKTSMADLIKMDIIDRPSSEDPCGDSEFVDTGYRIKPIQMADYSRDPNMEVAAITGDVLADSSDDYIGQYRESPTLNVYDN